MGKAFREKVERLVREARKLERSQKKRIEDAKARRESAMNFETPDTIPVGISVGPAWSDWYLNKRYHIKVGRFWRDPELLVEYELRTWIDSFRDFEDDRTFVLPNAVGPLGGVVLHPSIVGCKTVFPEDDFAWIDLRHRVFDSEEKIDDFVTPDIPSAGLMPETLERLEAVRRLVDGIIDVRILGGDGAPLQMAAYTRGLLELIRDMYTNPPIVHKLMRKMMDVYEEIQMYYETEWGIHYKGSEIEGRFYDNPLSYFSPKLVEEYVFPYYQRFAEMCGWTHWSFETQDNMDEFIGIFKRMPIRTIHSLVSSSNLTLFRETLGPRGVRFGVFLAPGRLLQVSNIAGEVKRVVEAMGLEGGWTLSSGVLDRAISERGIQTFIKAARRYGKCR